MRSLFHMSYERYKKPSTSFEMDAFVKKVLYESKVDLFLERVSTELKIPSEKVQEVFEEADGDLLVEVLPANITEPHNVRKALDKTVKCDWPILSGIRKGQPCGKSCIVGTTRCRDHVGKEAGRKTTRDKDHCMAVLEFGARAGEECGNELFSREDRVCRRHFREGKKFPRPVEVPEIPDAPSCMSRLVVGGDLEEYKEEGPLRPPRSRGRSRGRPNGDHDLLQALALSMRDM